MTPEEFIDSLPDMDSYIRACAIGFTKQRDEQLTAPLKEQITNLSQALTTMAEEHRDEWRTAEDRIKVLEDALRFYADEGNYREYNQVSSPFLTQIETDKGKTAREALND
jgi:uncharacterized protein (DUF2461 family)